jgi:eukaryotic-like serine/threonine-protein kinase
MPTGNICVSCGAEIPLDAPEGQCIKCLLHLAFAPAEPALHHGWIGQVGKYELFEELGRGGMGIVYEAKRLTDGQTVALKMILPTVLVSPVAEQRFANEVRAAEALDHPNIVSIYEVGEENWHYFYTMKYVPGVNLAQKLLSFRFPRLKSVEIIAVLAEAVAFAHQNGILHRDINPGNILIDQFGRPFLTDFGVAKIVNDETDLTRTVAILGTPSYISPEQAMGRSKEVTAASDVYSLGAVLYEVLTGQPPFQAETTFALLQKVINVQPVQPELLNPEIDPSLSAICMRALAKECEQRYQSADAFSKDLYRYLAFEPVKLQRNSLFTILSLWCRRNPVLASIIIMAPLVFAAGLIGFLLGR